MTNTTPKPTAFDALDVVVAREYLRVSFDESGHVRSNEEQHAENVPIAERFRWQLGLPYEDVGSASKFQRKRRVDFDKLIRDLEAGTFDARVLILWEGSRGSRKVSEWAHLLELNADADNRIWVTTDRRLYDPSVPRDWKTLMEDAVDSEYEARKTSVRVRRSSKANSEVGSFSGGRRPFGFKANGIDHERGDGLDQPDEVAIIKRCVDLAIAGRSIRSIAAELNEAGVKTSAGNAWHPTVLRDMLSSKRLIGKRVHDKVVVGDAAWKGVITEAKHKRLLAVLATRNTVGNRGRTPWLLTGFLRCDRCDATLCGNTDVNGTRRYVCRSGVGYRGCGGLGIKSEPLEELLGDLVMERLADVEARRHAITGPDDSDELTQLDEIAATRVEADDDRASGEISRDTYNGLMAALDRRQRRLEQALAAKVRDTAPLDFVAAEGFIGRQWSELGIEDQRVVLGALIERVTVARSECVGTRIFEPQRVTAPGRIVWRV